MPSGNLAALNSAAYQNDNGLDVVVDHKNVNSSLSLSGVNNKTHDRKDNIVYNLLSEVSQPPLNTPFMINCTYQDCYIKKHSHSRYGMTDLQPVITKSSGDLDDENSAAFQLQRKHGHENESYDNIRASVRGIGKPMSAKNVRHRRREREATIMRSSKKKKRLRRSWPHKSTSKKHKLNFQWPRKKVVETVGDVVIGGLMMVHERQDDLVCGPVMPQGGVQALETMLFTLDAINTNSHMAIPGMTLGSLILDDCDKDTYGLEQAVDFIKGE